MAHCNASRSDQSERRVQARTHAHTHTRTHTRTRVRYSLIRSAVHPVRWLVLLGHSPFYSSSTGHKQGNPELRAAIEDLVVRAHVDLALWGDDHGYERSFPVINSTPVSTEPSLYHVNTAPIHVLCGTAGMSLDEFVAVKPDWSAVRIVKHGAAILTADSSQLQFSFLDTDGNTHDQFTIAYNGKCTLSLCVRCVKGFFNFHFF
jgi:hypothetical protein